MRRGRDVNNGKVDFCGLIVCSLFRAFWSTTEACVIKGRLGDYCESTCCTLWGVGQAP